MGSLTFPARYGPYPTQLTARGINSDLAHCSLAWIGTVKKMFLITIISPAFTKDSPCNVTSGLEDEISVTDRYQCLSFPAMGYWSVRHIY